MARRKFYVVFDGYQPGIYDSWEECEAQINGYHGAKYRSYDTCEEATAAFRGQKDAEELQFYKFFKQQTPQITNYEAFPEVRLDAIAVDGACDKNPGGKIEYQGVVVGTGEKLFHVGPLEGGSNNIAEYLALVHALAYLNKKGDYTTPIYSDSINAQSWIRKGHNRSTVKMDPASQLAQILARADRWLALNSPPKNPILKWQTQDWGEIPADFGRK